MDPTTLMLGNQPLTSVQRQMLTLLVRTEMRFRQPLASPRSVASAIALAPELRNTDCSRLEEVLKPLMDELVERNLLKRFHDPKDPRRYTGTSTQYELV